MKKFTCNKCDGVMKTNPAPCFTRIDTDHHRPPTMCHVSETIEAAWEEVPWDDDKRVPIIGIMKSINEQASDTIWYNDGYTVFERLWDLYLECAGEESELKKEFPEYS